MALPAPEAGANRMTAPTSPLLRASTLCVRFGGVVAVSAVDVTVAEKELVCIIGPNGAGKSTLLNVFTGTQASEGSLAFDGEELLGRPPHEYCRRGIVRKFQGANVFSWLTVRQNLLVAGMGPALHHRLHMPDSDEILEMTNLTPHADKVAETLSHGQRQWLEIAMALMCRPRLLLLDEPTAGMTVEGSNEMAHLVLRLRGECAVVVIEHDMKFVESLGCRTLVMHQGAVVADGSYDTLRNDDAIKDIYLGRRAQGAARALH
jgi:branched-chain amino acid transport system ATP-binding protein